MQLAYEADWSTYEEWGAIKILEEKEKYFVQYGGRSVYTAPEESDWMDPQEISLEEAIDLIDEWDNIQKEYEHYFD